MNLKAGWVSILFRLPKNMDFEETVCQSFQLN